MSLVVFSNASFVIQLSAVPKDHRVRYESHRLHFCDVIVELLLLFGLFGTVTVNFLQAFADVLLVLLAALVELDARLVVRYPAFAEVAKFARL